MATKDLIAPVPGLPSTFDDPVADVLKHYWTIYYRHGVNPQLTKNFKCLPPAGETDPKRILAHAVKRAQEHCGIMGYKYYFLRPMVCDIDVEEKVQLEKIGD